MTASLAIPLGLLAGFVLGLVHFGSLWWNVRLYTGGGGGRAVAVQLLRLAVLAAGLFALAQLGAAALLSGALGTLLARTVLLRWARRAL